VTSDDRPAWDPRLYAENTAHHRRYDDWFLDSTPIQPGQRILDLGCGSGDFTRTLADLVGDGEVVGIDPHPGFVEEASLRAGPNQRFAVGSAQNLSTVAGRGRFDGVVSRAALQWAPCADQPEIARQVSMVLKPGGWFRLEMSGAGNIRRVVALLDDVSSSMGGPSAPWCFADTDWYLEVLERAGFDVDEGHVRSVAQRRPFSSESLRGWLESQTVIAYESSMTPSARDEFRRRVFSRLDELRRQDGTYDQTFVRLDVLAHHLGP